MLNLFRRYRVFTFLLIALFIVAPFLVLAIDNTLDGYRIKKNALSIPVFWNTANIITPVDTTPIGTCINNTSSYDYFVPTRTINEWNAFINKKPSGVTLVGCCGDGGASIYHLQKLKRISL